MASKVLFLTGLFPKEIRDDIIQNSKFNIQFAADALQWALVKGLHFYYKDLKILNFPFLGSYPTLYKTPFIEQFNFSDQSDIDGLNIGYFNFIGIKNLDIYYKAKKYITTWALENDGQNIVIIYSAFLPFLKAAIAVKKELVNFKVYLILPDLPQYMGGPSNLLYNVFKYFTNTSLQESFEHVDGFIVLSKYMMERLPVAKPYTVVEGIFNNEESNYLQKVNTSEKKVILYTGTLAKRYGIVNLIEAFKMIKNDNFRLIICGNGDAKDDVVFASETDKRIIYKGSLDRSEVLKMQQNAALLVNPRTAEGEFTKFSFPSKTMEYLVSGVPTLLYKIQGIPDEYYNYCFSLEGSNVGELAEKIVEILSLDDLVLIEKGKKAREFILNNKNPEKQCKKIFDLIEH